jgi:hypothetical protein
MIMVTITIICCTLVFGAVFIGQVGNTTSIADPMQRKCFRENGYYWAFWSNTTHMLYANSSDDTSFSAETSVRTCTKGSYFGVDFYSNDVAYAYADDTVNNTIIYRRGDLGSGSITWGTERTAVAVQTNVTYSYVQVILDTSGYPHIFYREYFDDGDMTQTYALKVTKSSNDITSDVWATAGGHPVTLSAADAK